MRLYLNIHVQVDVILCLTFKRYFSEQRSMFIIHNKKPTCVHVYLHEYTNSIILPSYHNNLLTYKPKMYKRNKKKFIEKTLYLNFVSLFFSYLCPSIIQRWQLEKNYDNIKWCISSFFFNCKISSLFIHCMS